AGAAAALLQCSLRVTSASCGDLNAARSCCWPRRGNTIDANYSSVNTTSPSMSSGPVGSIEALHRGGVRMRRLILEYEYVHESRRRIWHTRLNFICVLTLCAAQLT